MDRTASAVVADDAPNNPTSSVPALTCDVALPGAFLRAMLACASQDVTRFHLHAIYFHGLHMVVTDGHTLTRASVLPVEGREGRDYLIGADMVQNAIKVAGARGTVEIWTNGKRGMEARGEFRCYAAVPARSRNVRGELISCVPWRAVQTTFAPYDQVIPVFDATPALVDDESRPVAPCQPMHFAGHGVNPRYLARIADVMEGIEGRDSATPLVLRGIKGPLDPIVYTAHVRIPAGLFVTDDKRMITFVIMPMRVSPSDYADDATKAVKAEKGGKRKAK